MENERFILRVTLQSASPLMISSGEDDALNDNMLVRDANGLPMLPATSLAGVLKAAVAANGEAWFGWQLGDKGDRSNVIVTDGLFHWSDNMPRDGVELVRTALEKDALCKVFAEDATPLTRQHVRLNERGTVDGTGKFARAAVPTGARFTFELQTSNRAAADALETTIKAGLWLGGATRSGYGQMVWQAFGREDMDLATDAGWNRWCVIAGTGIGDSRKIEMGINPALASHGADWVLSGQIEGPLLIGGLARTLDEDRAPWREAQIKWDGPAKNPGHMGPEVFVIPGSAIKGPIRHRTLFHLHKAGVADAEAVAKAMFGAEAKGKGGHAGLLRFHDCMLPDMNPFKQTHVGLDRFTGGARRGVLFTDAMLWQPELTIRISGLKPLTAEQHTALDHALNDMANGLCGIGAEWGEGAGVFASGASCQHPPAPSPEIAKGDADAA